MDLVVRMPRATGGPAGTHTFSSGAMATYLLDGKDISAYVTDCHITVSSEGCPIAELTLLLTSLEYGADVPEPPHAVVAQSGGR